MAASSSNETYSSFGQKKTRRTKLIAVVSTVLIVCAGILIFAGVHIYEKKQQEIQMASVLDTGKFYKGTVVEGIDVGGMSMQQALDALKAKEQTARGTYSINITNGEKKWGLTENDMAFSYNTQDVLKQAYAYARTGDREVRYKLVNALKLQPKKYSITASLDENALKTKVEKIASEVSRSPVNPTVVSFNASTKSFTCKDGTDGLTVDTAALWSGVKDIAESKKTGTVQMQTKAVPFSSTMAEFKSHLQKLGTFSTTSTNTANGTYNMSRALAALNGTCVPAGKTLSFFSVVGPCDQAHGYRPGGAIFNGKLIQEYGGGICQASTTLYGAVLRSGMKIIERSNHSMPSSYCAIGQDATVSYPYLDLKFQNTSKYPVYIVTQTSGMVLTASIYGYQPSDYDNIEITSKIDQTIPAPSQAKYTEDDSLSAGTIKQVSRARTGYKASAQRIYYKNGKAVKTENLPSSYYDPQAASYSYGKGTNLPK